MERKGVIGPDVEDVDTRDTLVLEEIPALEERPTSGDTSTQSQILGCTYPIYGNKIILGSKPTEAYQPAIASRSSDTDTQKELDFIEEHLKSTGEYPIDAYEDALDLSQAVPNLDTIFQSDQHMLSNHQHNMTDVENDEDPIMEETQRIDENPNPTAMKGSNIKISDVKQNVSITTQNLNNVQNNYMNNNAIPINEAGSTNIKATRQSIPQNANFILNYEVPSTVNIFPVLPNADPNNALEHSISNQNVSRDKHYVMNVQNNYMKVNSLHNINSGSVNAQATQFHHPLSVPIHKFPHYNRPVLPPIDEIPQTTFQSTNFFNQANQVPYWEQVPISITETNDQRSKFATSAKCYNKHNISNTNFNQNHQERKLSRVTLTVTETTAPIYPLQNETVSNSSFVNSNLQKYRKNQHAMATKQNRAVGKTFTKTNIIKGKKTSGGRKGVQVPASIYYEAYNTQFPNLYNYNNQLRNSSIHFNNSNAPNFTSEQSEKNTNVEPSNDDPKYNFPSVSSRNDTQPIADPDSCQIANTNGSAAVKYPKMLMNLLLNETNNAVKNSTNNLSSSQENYLKKKQKSIPALIKLKPKDHTTLPNKNANNEGTIRKQDNVHFGNTRYTNRNSQEERQKDVDKNKNMTNKRQSHEVSSAQNPVTGEGIGVIKHTLSYQIENSSTNEINNTKTSVSINNESLNTYHTKAYQEINGTKVITEKGTQNIANKNENQSTTTTEPRDDSKINKNNSNEVKVQKCPLVNIFKCKCGLHFINEYNLNAHCLKCSPDTSQPEHECEICRILFAENDFYIHYYKHHQVEKYLFKIIGPDRKYEPIYKCDVCNLTFKISDFRKHKLTCSTETATSKKNKTNKPNEITSKDNKNANKSLIKYIGKTVKSLNYDKPQFRSKIKLPSTDNAILFKCKQCDIHFLNKSNLDYHVRKKHKYHFTPLNCDECDLIFPVRALTKHKAVHHKLLKYTKDDFIIEDIDTEEVIKTRNDTKSANKNKNTTKTVAGKGITYKTKPVSKDSEENISNKLYHCGACSVYFLSSRVLAMHLSKHNSNKKYHEEFRRCEICKLKFTSRAYTLHVMRHHVRRRFDKFEIVTRYPSMDISQGSITSEDDSDEIERNLIDCSFILTDTLRESNTKDTSSAMNNEDPANPKNNKAPNKINNDSIQCFVSLTDILRDDNGENILQNHILSTPTMITEDPKTKSNTLSSETNNFSVQNSRQNISDNEGFIANVNGDSYEKHKINKQNIDELNLDIDWEEYDNYLYKCDKCLVHFVAPEYLLNHIKDDCESNPRKITCDICGLPFLIYNINMHLFIHHKKMNLTRDDFNIISIVGKALEKLANINSQTEQDVEDNKNQEANKESEKSIPTRELRNRIVEISQEAETVKVNNFQVFTEIPKVVEDENVDEGTTIRIKTKTMKEIKISTQIVEDDSYAITNVDKMTNERSKNIAGMKYRNCLYKCHECLTHFTGTRAYQKHMEQNDHEVKKSKCRYCSLFFEEESIKRHVHIHHYVGKFKKFRIINQLGDFSDASLGES